MAVCSHLVPVSVFAGGVSTMSLSAEHNVVPYPAFVFQKNHVLIEILLPSFRLDFTIHYIFFFKQYIFYGKNCEKV